MNSDLESLKSFLVEVSKHVAPARETTVFDVGGRGYYENPATDLLKFFLMPDAGHGLGDLFLSTFLECIGEGHRQLDLRSVDIESQVKTAKGNFIDLQILERNWCLIIENKIYHGPSNPFLDYEVHAGQLRNDPKNLFSILAPNETLPPEGSATPGRWKPVTYKNYFQKLRDRMATRYFEVPFSKWQLFAREFILHIENELGLHNPPMKPEDAKFVEDNADKFVEAQKLAWQYQEFVCAELKRELEASVSGHTFNVNDAGWGFRCSTQQWRGAEIFLLKDFKIRADLFLDDISEPQQSSAMDALRLGPDGSGFQGGRQYRMWKSVVGFDSRDKAIAKLCECAKTVNGLIKK